MAGLSKGLIEVGISMVLRDQFSQQAGMISGSFNSLMNDMNMWNRALTSQTGVAFDYGLQLSGGIVNAYKHYAEVNKQIFLTSKMSEATVEQTQALSKLTKDINMETPLTNLDIASGERYLAMAGNNAEAIQKMIRPAAQLASIFDMSLGGKGGTADLMTNIMATFGIASEKSTEVADVLTTATTNANINLIDLAQSLQYSGAVLRNAGVDIQTASAAIGVLGDQGIQASSAGTALANMFRYLTLSITGQKTKGASMLKALGISKDDLVDATGNLKRLDQIVAVFSEKMKDLSGTAREVAMYNIFGVRGQRAASALMQDYLTNNKLTMIMDKTYNSAGTTQKIMDEYLNTAQGKIDMLTSAVDNLKTSFGEINSGPLNYWIGGLSKIINLFAQGMSNSGLVGWVVQAGSMAIISMTIVNGFRLLFKVVGMVGRLMNGGLTTSMQRASTGMQRIVLGAKELDMYMQHIVALMMEYTAMAMGPGSRMVLPGGGVLGKGKTGKIYTTYPGKKGRGGVGWYMGNLAGGTTTTAPKPVPTTPKPTPPATGRFGKFGATASKLGRGAMGFGAGAMALMGGPWGLALTAGLMLIPTLIDAVGSNTDATNGNTDAIDANSISKMSNSEFMSFYQEAWTSAFKEAIAKGLNGGDNQMSLNINVNGTSYGQVANGDTINIEDDPWGTW